MFQTCIIFPCTLVVQMEEVCFDMETFILQQAITRAKDLRKYQAEADSRRKREEAAAAHSAVSKTGRYFQSCIQRLAVIGSHVVSKR